MISLRSTCGSKERLGTKARLQIWQRYTGLTVFRFIARRFCRWSDGWKISPNLNANASTWDCLLFAPRSHFARLWFSTVLSKVIQAFTLIRIRCFNVSSELGCSVWIRTCSLACFLALYGNLPLLRRSWLDKYGVVVIVFYCYCTNRKYVTSNLTYILLIIRAFFFYFQEACVLADSCTLMWWCRYEQRNF